MASLTAILPKSSIFKIAIDGPAASGKSTTARHVAHRLGFTYIDSGAMYRAITLKALRRNIQFESPSEMPHIINLANTSKIHFATTTPIGGSGNDNTPQTIVYLDDEDVSADIRTMNVSRNVSFVAALPEVRKAMLAKQRRYANSTDIDGVVMDGRDIGTAVLPDAQVKIFLTAITNVRAMRRYEQLKKKEKELVVYEEILRDIEKRDKADLERKVSPLRKAIDAVVLDTTTLSLSEIVGKIIEMTNNMKSDAVQLSGINSSLNESTIQTQI
ncbi:3177_t:CDS:2 [Ambispora gerdemannii]|uniref:(d)CMP kinase n=1 Tax=Ambispora gerdemannii TaxID=144530 RepID=A0A9N9G0X1_9GLOM|nr:3177_t:CDS:2 [Ambispora gerdemannii]